MNQSIRKMLSPVTLAVAFTAICGITILTPATALALGPGVDLPSYELDPVCRTSGNRIVVVYSHRSGDTTPTPTSTLRSVVKRMNWKIADQSSLSSEGKRILRMPVDCTADGQINVYNVTTSNNYLETLRTEVSEQLFGYPSGEQKSIKYLVFDHAKSEKNPELYGVAEGGGAASSAKSNSNALATHTGTAAIYVEVWENHVTIHELFHTMGAVNYYTEADPPQSPNSDGEGHCLDSWDIMCSNKWSGPCSEYEGYDDPVKVPIDCGKDDYFNAAPKPGNWLYKYWNIAGRENWFLVAPPKTTTEAATSVKGLSAVLNGVVDPEGTRTSYYFEYGKTTSYGSKTPTVDIGFGGPPSEEGPKKVEPLLSGLKLGTTYHFRAVATNIDGVVVKGEDKTFTTLTPPTPTITTEAASGIGTTEATLSGAVNPNGTDAIYWFEYGRTTSYGQSMPAYGEDPWSEAFLEEKILSGAESIKVSEKVSLEPHVTYHFRLKAINEGGTSYSEDRTFTTPRDVKPPTFSLAFGSAGSGNGQFSEPYDIAAGSEGNLWVTDSLNSRVQKFNSKGEYLAQFGTKGSGNGQLNRPRGIAIDAEGNLWVVDSFNKRIQKFNSKGEYLSQFGKAGEGNGQFESPRDITIDPTGNLWVTDAGNERVQKFNSKGEYLSQFGEEGQGNGQFESPNGIAADSGGNLWVVDKFNRRIQKFNSEGKYLSQFGKFGSGDGQFYEPTDIAIDAEGNLWVSDSSNNRVQEIYPEGEYISKFGSKGSGEGQLSSPFGLVSGTEGSLWVADAGNNRIEKWQKPTPPAVATGAASSIKRSEATLNATINPGGTATSYQFEYGTTTAYGTKAPASPKAIGSGTTAVKVSEALSGLKAGTIYHYHVVASSEKGTTYGEDRYFTTLAPPGPEAAWRIGGKTLSELKLSKESFALSGSFKIEIADIGVTYNCTETGSGAISGTNTAEIHMTLGCKSAAEEKCTIEPIEFNFSGSGGALHPASKTWVLITSECPWKEQLFTFPETFSAEFGTEAVKLPVLISASGKFGAHSMPYSSSSTWELSGANKGKVLGIW